MPAGGFRTFVAGETLDEDKINDYLMQGVLVFADSAARGSAIGTAVHGQVSFLKDTNSTEFYDGSQWTALSAGITIDYVVVGGGGGGGSGPSGGNGGGGAGGYFAGSVIVEAGTYPLVVGAGGAALAIGNSSVFATVSPVGGGIGGFAITNAQAGAGRDGTSGGSGGGGTEDFAGSTGFLFQGKTGGTGATANGGGGGGASANAPAAVAPNGGAGGAGIASSITGTSVTRGGGGGGSSNAGAVGAGGAGGGGNGGNASTAATSGTANTGGGGGGGRAGAAAGQGGSGVVIFAVPTGTSVSFSGGVTETNSTVSDKQVYIVTATSTTSETVTIG